MKKKLQLLAILALVCTLLTAQPPANYYKSAFGTKKEALKTAMKEIIRPHDPRSYADLWSDFQVTDKRADGKVWDMYSDCDFTFVINQCGNYQNICDCYNREHSMPKSWFNGDVPPMYTDLFHMYPTDGKVNNYRDNYPFGETNGTQYGSGKLGASTFPGYTGKVFEPADEYKGDFARTYFYMVTCYEDEVPAWTSSDAMQMLNATKYPSFQSWAINLLLKWSRNDEVSQKEIDRNNVVYELQDNRNPFIDFPQLAEYIWGDSITYTFDPTAPPTQLEDTKIMPPVLYVADGTLYINISSEGAFIQLYNACGQLIIKEQSTSGTHNIPLKQERFYIVCINDYKGNSWTYKILNNK
ncbi:MAG: endonuclease [Candidatus Azobacteroides sp.]|nr:endonuclease [Candidatus Azobacteroides sp.]